MGGRQPGPGHRSRCPSEAGVAHRAPAASGQAPACSGGSESHIPTTPSSLGRRLGSGLCVHRCPRKGRRPGPPTGHRPPPGAALGRGWPGSGAEQQRGRAPGQGCRRTRVLRREGMGAPCWSLRGTDRGDLWIGGPGLAGPGETSGPSRPLPPVGRQVCGHWPLASRAFPPHAAWGPGPVCPEPPPATESELDCQAPSPLSRAHSLAGAPAPSSATCCWRQGFQGGLWGRGPCSVLEHAQAARRDSGLVLHQLPIWGRGRCSGVNVPCQQTGLERVPGPPSQLPSLVSRGRG